MTAEILGNDLSIWFYRKTQLIEIKTFSQLIVVSSFFSQMLIPIFYIIEATPIVKGELPGIVDRYFEEIFKWVDVPSEISLKFL